MIRHVVLVWLVLLLAARSVPAQQRGLPPVDSSRVVELRLRDSTSVRGRVVAEDLASLTLVTGAGVRLTVPLASLIEWRDVVEPPAAAAELDPGDSRLFLAHTARPVPKGRLSVLDYLIFFPVLNYGATSRLTLTGGMSLIPFSPNQLFYLAPKYTVLDSPGASLAAGVLYLRLVGFVPSSGYAGIAYGVTTLGGPASSATALVGFPFASGGWERRPLVVLGGQTRISPRVKVLAEGWSLPGTNVIPAVGGMRLIGKSVSWDFGLLFLLGSKETGGRFLPWVDVTFHL